jgi:hypothetical protein
MTQARRVRLSAIRKTDMWSRWKPGQHCIRPGNTSGIIGGESTPIQSWYGTCNSQALNEKMSEPSTDGLRSCCPGPNCR